MVFIYHLLPSPATSQLASKADSFFKDIERGRYIGMISSFSIAEYVGVIRELLCNKRHGQVSNDEIRKIREKFEEFLMNMGIILYDADSLEKRIPVFSECERVVENSVAYKGKRDRKWHCIKGADALHVAFALSVNAEAIATFDDDFRAASEFIGHIMLSEAY